MRPNIRVEIQNNLAEAMDVDENEEGEISDKEDEETTSKIPFGSAQEQSAKSSKLTFTTGINVLDKNDQEKLQERARRFQLKPEEIKNFTDEDLQLLNESLGITPLVEANVRFDAIHMRGTEGMTGGELLDYFLEYAPDTLEWITEDTFNIVWSDKMSAARALHFISKPVRGMPVRNDRNYIDTLQEIENDGDQSILLLNKNREVQLQEEGEVLSKLNEKNSVDISEIATTIPPGYWRLGNKHPKSKCFLMRFSLKTDQKPFRSEPFSKYYKSQGKRGVMTAKHSQGIFARNKDIAKASNQKNPWSALAENWDEDAKFRERERVPVVEEPKIEIKNSSLRVRLGSKRKDVEEEVESAEVPKKVKIPRMRMYADEEEEKIKKKKMLKEIDRQFKQIDDETSTATDLRKILNKSNRNQPVVVEENKPEVFDLGATLKNRNKKMIFEIQTEVEPTEEAVEEDWRTRRRKEGHFSRRLDRRRHDRYSDDESPLRRRLHRQPDEESHFRSDYIHNKPQSKVAVVIKTQKKPTVASTVAHTTWARVNSKSNHSDSRSNSSELSSSSKSSSSDEEEEMPEVLPKTSQKRPGFSGRLGQANHKSPLKIEINNDHFKAT